MSLAADIARRMLSKRGGATTAKAAPKPPRPAVQPRTSSATARTGVGTTPAVTLRSAPPYVPPRHEPDLVEVYRSLPEVWGPVEVAPPPVVVRAGWKGSCKAVDANNGRTCKLLAGHTTAHRHERGEFFRTAEPGTTSFPLREALDAVALAGIADADRPSDRQMKRESRERLKAGIRMRRAHAGDSTSTGIKSIDSSTRSTTEEAA